MPVPCQTLTVTQCIQNWVCEEPRTGYEIDGCGHRRLNPACGVLRGQKLKLEAVCTAGILQYLWLLNSQVLSETTNTIIIDTVQFPEGDSVIGLMARDDCGWSQMKQVTITIIETGCSVPKGKITIY